MKKFKRFSYLIFILILLCITGCKLNCTRCKKNPVGENPPDNTIKPNTCNHVDSDNNYICDLCKQELSKPSHDPVIEITTKEKSIELKDEKIQSYDFKQLFVITEDKNNIVVKDEYIDKSSIDLNNPKPGKYIITCNYKDKKESIELTIIETVYEITLEVEEITINKSLVNDYDYLSLFKVYKDDKKLNITDKMISSNVKAEEGRYEFTISYKGVSKTLIVNVTNSHKLEIVPAYKQMSIQISNVEGYDFTKLFLLYVDGVNVQITNEMLNFTKIENPEINKEYELELTYTYEEDVVSNSISIIIIEDDEICITSKNVVIYPNQEQVNLTTLFEIKQGENIIEVTYDMIEGIVDYSSEGINEITLNYKGITSTATVEIKRGVIIDYTYGDTIIITKGTNQASYAFINDFKVMINGLTFTNISTKYIKENNVDFSIPGEYSVTISIPYNDQKFGLSGVKFTYFEKTIKYVVVENDYQITLNKETVILPKGTTSYDVYKNLTVYINGRKQQLTDIKEYVDSITCYAKIVSENIDFSSSLPQEVIIEVYANGVNNNPEIVKFEVLIESDIKVSAINKSIYSGDTLYKNDLFEVRIGNELVNISNDMITGILDVFTPGTYTLEIDYEGITATSTVVVLDSKMKGTYITNIDTFKVVEEEDSDIDFYSLNNSTEFQRELKILDDGTILFDKREVEIVKSINESTFIINIRSYEYTLYYENGIIILDPNNDIKLTYNIDKMPMVFFNTNKWILEDKLCINYSNSHVLDLTYVTYSIDAYKIKSIESDETSWYGMKIHCVDKIASDTVYSLQWGYLTFDDNFKQAANSISSVILNNQEYKFTMIDENVAKIKESTNTKEYANKIFVGTYNGLPAELRADEHEAYSFYVNGELLAKSTIADINNMINGGTDHYDKIVFIYDWNDDIYSYKFKVNPDNNTFEFIEKDTYYGLYKTDSMYVLIDGYGTGIVNFNTKSYYNYSFEYTVNNGLLRAKFINTKPSFEYGEYIDFYIPEFKNTLEIKYCYLNSYKGIILENNDITTGAIVRINSYQVGQDSDAVAKAELIKNIQIITKDGELSNEDKVKCIDTSKIRFNTPGFYQLTITINVDGVDITQYYAIEVLETIYNDNPIVGAYGSGVIFGNYSLEINKYGQATLICDSDIYKGFITINDDYSFVINGSDSSNKKVKLTGEYISEGIIFVKCTGSIVFNDYFTKGSVNYIGTSGCYIREIIVNNNSTYIYASDKNLTGEIVEVNLVKGTSIKTIGSIIEIVLADKSVYAKIESWNNTTNGLSLADKYRGTYKNSEKEDIFLDGFGNATIGSVFATYTLNGRTGILITSTDTLVCNFNIDTYEYTVLDVKLDASLVNGKSFSAAHTFYCGYYAYTAQTKFVFSDKGKVTVYSVSENHDGGSDACMEDIYEAPYASKSGVVGTYLVSGNILTVTVNNYVITFIIDDVVKGTQITCKTSTITSDLHGYIEIGTVFTIE